MDATKKLLVVLAVIGLSASVYGDIPAVQLECWTEGSTPVVWNPPGSDNGDESYDFVGARDDVDGHWSLSWDMTVKPDPWVNAVYGLTNTSGTVQNFTLIVTLPVFPPITPSSLMGGSTGGSINDANFDGIGTLATLGPGTSFYAGQIDNVSMLPLYPDPYSVSVPFQGGTANIPAISAGLPGPTLPGPAVNVNIGIMHQFSLTPGDTVAITSFFVATPEPTSLLLLGLGVLALRRR